MIVFSAPAITGSMVISNAAVSKTLHTLVRSFRIKIPLRMIVQTRPRRGPSTVLGRHFCGAWRRRRVALSSIDSITRPARHCKIFSIFQSLLARKACRRQAG